MSGYEISPDAAAAVATKVEPEKRRGVGRFYYEDGRLHVAADIVAEVEAALSAIDPATPTLPKRQFGFLEFMGLFTSGEQDAIASSQDAKVKLFLLMAAGAEYIDLDDSRTSDGIQTLAALGLISEPRCGEILEGRDPTPV